MFYCSPLLQETIVQKNQLYFTINFSSKFLINSSLYIRKKACMATSHSLSFLLPLTHAFPWSSQFTSQPFVKYSHQSFVPFTSSIAPIASSTDSLIDLMGSDFTCPIARNAFWELWSRLSRCVYNKVVYSKKLLILLLPCCTVYAI